MANASDQSTNSSPTTQTPGGAKPCWHSIILDLPADEAMALAQLVKRFGYDDAERLSSRHDGGAERNAMLNGIGKLQSALADAGHAPR